MPVKVKKVERSRIWQENLVEHDDLTFMKTKEGEYETWKRDSQIAIQF